MAVVAENAPPVTNENTAPPAVAVEEKTEKANGDIVTVFHDPENFNVKHPLMHEWTLWFTKPPSGKVERASLRPRKVFRLRWLENIRATTGTIC